ncbi:hypothetical protein ABPG72_006444 [Tetrahymena utriculariae]
MEENDQMLESIKQSEIKLANQEENEIENDDSFEYVEPDGGISQNFIQMINSIRKDQYDIKTDQNQIIDKNMELQSQIEFLEITFQKKIQSNQEIGQLEKELEMRKKSILEIFEIDNFSLHMLKQHNKNKFNDLQEAINYYQFLLSKSIIYKDWHTFHCQQCMSFITKNQNIIQQQIKNYFNLEQQISDIKSSI